MKKVIFIITVLAILTFLAFSLFEEDVDFNKEVRPILNDKCMSCHGGVKSQAGLSFLFRDAALDTLESGSHAIVPGSVSKSKMIDLISEDDPELRMPPEGEPLSKDEISTLKKWIKQGANWVDHWAYIPPVKNIDPPSNNSEWISNGIDHFVLQKLQENNLSPTEKASKETLLRRVSLDLIGLPPDELTINAFINDSEENAFEHLVDKLLESEHFGERWASMWLDLARYADSQGYQKDKLRRTMWIYRDWVINAFNNDMPFDQFTIEQLAGDLMPNATDDQFLATAFHRNTMSNDEGGTDDEEYRVAAVLDRVNSTYEIWQGTSIACVQCHSHPYDPIEHKEYYQSYAVFNTTADDDNSNDQPNMLLQSPVQKLRASRLEKEIIQFKESADTVSDSFKNLVSEFRDMQAMKVPVMREIADSIERRSHIFERGNWLAHGDTVSADLPKQLNKFTQEQISNRLDFAQWLVHEDNPLTSRVIVNRFWEQLFGIGIVETVEDFGTEGAKPSNQALLDYLAAQFSTEMNWSVKKLLKAIVMSSTYQQSSKVTNELLDIDPYNKLNSRGPRVRLSAEQVRDQALVVSGLLNTSSYGPSVMPHQPEGVWNTIRHVAKWQMADDGDQYRRALYTFWRRVSPYPSMITFDRPSHEFCVSRRIRTNTPLQALVTLNDPVYVEASNALAKNMLAESNELTDQINFGFKRALARSPKSTELKTMVDLYNQTSEKSNDNELIAINTVASAIMNLDEFIMKS